MGHDSPKLPHPGWALSVFGATGLTAWFGLTDIGKAKAGGRKRWRAAESTGRR